MLAETKPETRTFIVVGDLFRILVNRGETDDHYIMVEAETGPGGGMPILHTHPASETFYVLAGQYEIYRRNEEGEKVAIPVTAGETAHVPGGAPHGFANVGEAPGKVLMVMDGAGEMDDFFAEIGIPVEDENNLPVVDGPPDMEALIAVCARYGMEFVERPPM